MTGAEKTRADLRREVSELAARIGAVERRVRVILPGEIEDRIRNLAAERDLYRTGCEEAWRKAERLDERIVNRGLLSDEEHQELKKEIEENERKRNQDMDGTVQEAADQGPETDSRGREALERGV